MAKTLIRESGIRDIKELAKRYPKARIYFHQDLDGVTTAIAMKKYLESNGIKVSGVEVIQYGEREFAISKVDAEGDTMPVLVDFAHGKPMFKIHTDHHDTQVGAGDTTATSFKESPSNVRTISQVLSPRDIFTDTDINLISTVDSAKFKGLKPKDIMNFVFRLDKEAGLEKNKFAMGLVANKLLLAYKNKKGFLEYLVMNSEPSLYSILNNIKKYAQENNLLSVDDMIKNQEKYIEQQRASEDIKYDDGIIVQYGTGYLRTGSYDRYTPFELHPDADFLVISYLNGMVQSSCNPFKENRALPGINLKKIADDVLESGRSWFESKIVPITTIKWVSESAAEAATSVGFTSKDLEAFYPQIVEKIKKAGKNVWEIFSKIMDKPYSLLSENELTVLDRFGIPLWDIIKTNSGGHRCITNISGLNYYGRARRRPVKTSYKRVKDENDEGTPYIRLIKNIQQQFADKLREEVKSST